MDIIAEIDIEPHVHLATEVLRNQSFPGFEVPRSYYKQLPHYRCLQYDGEELIGYMGLDYRSVRAGAAVYKILGVVDLCVAESQRGKGVGTQMLAELTIFAQEKDVDFIMLMSDSAAFYERNGFEKIEAQSFWLKIHEHQTLGIAEEFLDDLYVKSTGEKRWADGPVDWLGYMF